jgi:hypothetical protein
MTDAFYFDFELSFTNTFDVNIIDNATIPDKDSTFKSIVEDEFNKINSILSLHTGVKVLSSFVDYNSSKYKIVVNKS